MADLAQELAQLFLETGKAHHQAFIDTDGEDPEWPLWYAERLQSRLSEMLVRSFTRSELVYLLVLADKEHRARGPDEAWSAFYARLFVEQVGQLA